MSMALRRPNMSRFGQKPETLNPRFLGRECRDVQLGLGAGDVGFVHLSWPLKASETYYL